MKLSERLLLVAAVVLALFGLVIILGTTISIFDRTSKSSVPGDVAGLIIAGVLPLALGVWLFWHTRLGASRRAFAARERTVLHLAGQHQGVLTVLQVADESDMTLEQAKAVLDHLYRQSVSELTLAESGELVYRFPLVP